MRRFFLENEKRTGDVVIIDGDQFFHLNKVLRLEKGEEVIVNFGDGFDHTCILIETTKNNAKAKILKTTKNDRDLKKNVTLFFGMPKGDKLEFVVQKGTELGLKKIVIFESMFCEKSFDESKLSRLEKISQEATKQCGGSIPLKIENVKNVDEMIELFPLYDSVIFANETEEIPLKSTDFSKKDNVAIIVGSEGGFSPQEIKKIIDGGAKSVSLGKRILRTETAAISLSSLAIFFLGENV